MIEPPEGAPFTMNMEDREKYRCREAHAQEEEGER
jgi:hypothetical protein